MFKSYPKAKIYADWREMLEKEPSIDAVMIGTPDHNHATIAAAFIKAKKHVYVEKPMAKTIFECRELAKLAKDYPQAFALAQGMKDVTPNGNRTRGEALAIDQVEDAQELDRDTD